MRRVLVSAAFLSCFAVVEAGAKSVRDNANAGTSVSRQDPSAFSGAYVTLGLHLIRQGISSDFIHGNAGRYASQEMGGRSKVLPGATIVFGGGSVVKNNRYYVGLEGCLDISGNVNYEDYDKESRAPMVRVYNVKTCTKGLGYGIALRAGVIECCGGAMYYLKGGVERRKLSGVCEGIVTAALMPPFIGFKSDHEWHVITPLLGVGLERALPNGLGFRCELEYGFRISKEKSVERTAEGVAHAAVAGVYSGAKVKFQRNASLNLKLLMVYRIKH
ncbi:MAG: hypothetical protein LBB63_02295 [Holosporaceae bacterium]|jgi:hypothetical protein|nr:hypothetical protein [Holosporaceae bacterium]